MVKTDPPCPHCGYHFFVVQKSCGKCGISEENLESYPLFLSLRKKEYTFVGILSFGTMIMLIVNLLGVEFKLEAVGTWISFTLLGFIHAWIFAHCYNSLTRISKNQKHFEVWRLQRKYTH